MMEDFTPYAIQPLTSYLIVEIRNFYKVFSIGWINARSAKPTSSHCLASPVGARQESGNFFRNAF